MKLAIHEIIAQAAAQKKEEDKIGFLQQHQSEPLKMILQFALDPRVKWLLPDGVPPYNEAAEPETHGMLYTEARRLYLFVEHSAPADMKPFKRESLFITMLESVHPQDAKLLLSAKDKKLPVKGLTVKHINKAFPGLIHEEKAEHQEA